MKIIVLCGGISPERDVSLKSGEMVYKALKERGHEVSLLDVYLGEEISGASIGHEAPDLEEVKAKKGKGKPYFGDGVLEKCMKSDMVFLALHGSDGENGKVQAAFDLFGIKYTGAGSLSSALAMEKEIAKTFFKKAGVPVPGGIKVKKGEDIPAFPLPCVIKPVSGGSSVGVTIANTREEYEAGLKSAFAWEKEALVENFIKGREFSCGVLGETVLPPIEIAPVSGFYDYKNKYTAGSTIETCPADIPQNITDEMMKYAYEACKSLGIDTYARMDFLLEEGSDKLYCLEANTLPGMTPLSLIPQEAAAIGVNYGELCEKIIELSFKKYE